MRIGANQRIALLLLATGPAPSAGELAGEVERQGNCGRDVAPKSVQRLMRGGLVRRLPGRGAEGSWGALELTASGRRYLSHRRTWWERKDGAPKRPEEWGPPRPLLAPERDEEPGPEPEPEPAAAGVLESPRRRERALRVTNEEREERVGIVLRGIDAVAKLAEARMVGRGAPSVLPPPRAQAPVAARRAAVLYDHCPGCGAPADALAVVPPPRSDPGYRAARCARCWGEFTR